MGWCEQCNMDLKGCSGHWSGGDIPLLTAKFKIGDKITPLKPKKDLVMNQVYTIDWLGGATLSVEEIALDTFYQSDFKLSTSLPQINIPPFQSLDAINSQMEELTGVKSLHLSPGPKPRVTRNEQICYFDVDETLISWTKEMTVGKTFIADYYGGTVMFNEYEPHILFLKAMKARGAHIIVHSGNGFAWAEQVVNLLELNAYVDEIKSKPTKVVDDSEYENWMPKRIFIQE